MANYASGPASSNRWRIFVVLIAGAVALCVVAVLAMWLLLPRLFPGLAFISTEELPLDTRTAKSSGPSLPLTDILAIAQKEARKIDKDVVLNYIDTVPVGYTAGVAYSGPTTGSLEISFYFYTPSGASVNISVEDADPSSTVRTFVDDVTDPDPEDRARYEDNRNDEPNYLDLLKSYKLTPRDAVAKTWEDSREYATKNGLATEHVLPLISTGRSQDGTPTWILDYWYKESRSTISLGSIFDVGDPVVSYVVDGLTGEIVSSEYGVVPSTPTSIP